MQVKSFPHQENLQLTFSRTARKHFFPQEICISPSQVGGLGLDDAAANCFLKIYTISM